MKSRMGLRKRIWICRFVALGLSVTMSACLSGNVTFNSTCGTGVTLSSLTANSIGSGSTHAAFKANANSCYSSVTVDESVGFQAANICGDTTIFGLAGTAACTQPLVSTANRNTFTTQLTQSAEVTTYAGTALPPNYRDIPSITKDLDNSTIGYCSAPAYLTAATCQGNPGLKWGGFCVAPTIVDSANCSTNSYTWVDNGSGCTARCSPIFPFSASVHAAYQDCGGNGFSTIDAAIQDCVSRNGDTATWDGALLGTHGESIWKLVARRGTNKEVWRDLKTKLLWSTANGTRVTWCTTTGNQQNTAAADCSTNTVSDCAELTGFTSSFTGEDRSSSSYASEKGGLGLKSTIVVTWRAPTVHDFLQAEVDGFRAVLPDSLPQEWSSTLPSAITTPFHAYYFNGQDGSLNRMNRSPSWTAYSRCVGQ
jgi:hypothetical protein